ncbi:glycerophosphodiester phosphodiesterase [Caulobacter sp. NIBR1757]|uniref:glycerophosphodiester phosphodiesterase n=1 Tax=Caulobacter sp. NIBR1757 TaxID=3016000 RepID=UPI0022F0BEC5|nr:glycerophosphodiester phosphodiesterase [Caulobacter sp. NIBR1757]WGM37549.1 Glycerophosphodiester phosphodiesterase, periplasmic [Caulobacter sp. NIBR1757]
MATVNAHIPVVIAHRGASGERPEHTASAYRLAIGQSADFIEPDLVVTRDGALVARHENEIGGTTDVAVRPEFAARKATKVIDGEQITGWFTEDFTLAELKTLRCRERLPKVRPGNTLFDGQDQILTFAEVAALAKTEGDRVGRRIGLYPEMKHPTYFASVGLPIEGRMAAALKAAGLDGADANAFVQCFEVSPLKTLRGLVKTPLVQLISDEGGPADAPGTLYASMATAEGLKAIGSYADGVGPEKGLVVPTDGKVLLPATAFVTDAHAAGLKVHPWTVRRENSFLPTSLRGPGDLNAAGDVQTLLMALFKAGVDGVFSDFPGEAVKARNRFIGAKA